MNGVWLLVLKSARDLPLDVGFNLCYTKMSLMSIVRVHVLGVYAVFVILLHGGGVFFSVSCRHHRSCLRLSSCYCLSLLRARTGDSRDILALLSSACRGQPGLLSLLAVDCREPRDDVSGSRRKPCICPVTEIKRVGDDPARSYSILDIGSNFMPPITTAATCTTYTS